jgi:hypothetical protein
VDCSNQLLEAFDALTLLHLGMQCHGCHLEQGQKSHHSLHAVDAVDENLQNESTTVVFTNQSASWILLKQIEEIRIAIVDVADDSGLSQSRRHSFLENQRQKMKEENQTKASVKSAMKNLGRSSHFSTIYIRHGEHWKE